MNGKEFEEKFYDKFVNKHKFKLIDGMFMKGAYNCMLYIGYIGSLNSVYMRFEYLKDDKEVLAVLKKLIPIDEFLDEHFAKVWWESFKEEIARDVIPHFLKNNLITEKQEWWVFYDLNLFFGTMLRYLFQ